MELKLWYDKPAEKWTEALPLGNGRIGAMVHGGIGQEKVCLNEDTLWSGYPHDKNEPGRYVYYRQARELAREHRYKEAQQLLEENFTGGFTESYMPMGDMLLKMEHGESDGKETGYRRELDLRTGVHRVSYQLDGCSYIRTTFLSYPAQVFVMHLQSERKGGLSFSLTFESQIRCTVAGREENLEIRGLCPSHADPHYLGTENPILYSDKKEETGIRFFSLIRVVTADGTVRNADKGIQVSDATEATVYLGVRNNFAGIDICPELAGKLYEEPCRQDVEAAAVKGFGALMKEHEKDFTSYFDRVSLNLGEDEKEGIPTYQRLKDFRETGEDHVLPVYLFQFGRYLTISASRPGSQATNLQGIWNDSTLPPWSSNYTININTEMNYWPAFSCNLAEMNQPLVHLIQGLCQIGRGTASRYYQAEGFVSHHNTDLWCSANPVGGKRRGCGSWAYWPMSSGWLCEHLYTQYEYTLDREFLEQTAYPIMKEAALFYLSVLEEEDGYLAFSPSTSPENNFLWEEEWVAVSRTNAMTMTIIRELFENCRKSGEILGIQDDFMEQVAEALDRLEPLRIGEDGRLLEWNEELPEAEPEHRHLSHLYGLFPSDLISLEKTPELAEACRKSLLARGFEGTGWSLGWKVNLWARLRDGDKALRLIKRQLHLAEGDQAGTCPDFFGSCPPFQIDGNFGVASGIAEMLLQSRDGQILLLPALPAEWNEGSISGLCAKGGVEVDMSWKEGQLADVKLYFSKDGTVVLRYQDSTLEMEVKAGETWKGIWNDGFTRIETNAS